LEAQKELKEVEEEIDKAVAGLYGITDDELEEVRKTLGVLKGEDVELFYIFTKSLTFSFTSSAFIMEVPTSKASALHLLYHQFRSSLSKGYRLAAQP